MAVRTLLKNRPILGGGIAVLVLCVAVWLAAAAVKPSIRNLTHGYFYDLGTGKVYLYQGRELEPVTAPSGGMGVRALVFSCESCAKTETHFVGYLQKYTASAKETLDRGELPPGDIEAQILVRRPDASDNSWVPRNSPAGKQICDSVSAQCPNRSAFECLP